MTEVLGVLVAIVSLMLLLDLTARRWGEDSRHEYGDRNW